MSRIRNAALCTVVPAAFVVAACTPPFDGPKPLDVRPVMTNTSDNGSADDLLYRSAVAAIGDRDYLRALDYLQAARDKQPRDVRVLNAFGVVYDKLGRFDLSARYYTQAKALDPKSTIVAANIAYSQLLQGLRKDDAAPVELASNVPDAHASVPMTGDGDADVSVQANTEEPASITRPGTILEPIKPEVLATAIRQPQLRFSPDAEAIAGAGNAVAKAQIPPVIPRDHGATVSMAAPVRTPGVMNGETGAKVGAVAKAQTPSVIPVEQSNAAHTLSVIPDEHDRVSDRAREGDPGRRVSTPLKISNETVLREVVPPPHLGPLPSPLTRLAGDDSVGRTTASPTASAISEVQTSPVIPSEHDRVSDRATEGDPGRRVSTPLKIGNETVLREVVPPPHLGPLPSPLTRLAGDDSVGRTTASPTASAISEVQTSRVIPGEHDRVSDRAREGDPGRRVSTPLKIGNETVLREVVPPPHLGPLPSPLTRLAGDDSVGRTTASPTAPRLAETKQSKRPNEALAKVGAGNDGARPDTSRRHPMLTGHPLVIVNASGQKAATERLRLRLAHLGWTVPRSSARDASGQRATTLYYPQRILAAARGLARTLRISVLLAPRKCNCGGLELVIGADILNRIAQIEDLDNRVGVPSLRTKVNEHERAKT